MDSILITSTTFLPKSNHNVLSNPNFFQSKTLQNPLSKTSISTKISSNYTNKPPNNQNPFAKTLKNATKTAILTVATTLIAANFNKFPANAQSFTPSLVNSTQKDEIFDEITEKDPNFDEKKSPISKLIESNDEFIPNLRSLLHEKLEKGEDEEALKILKKLVEAEPSEMEWKFMLARLYNEMGKKKLSREVFEEILEVNPLSFEALLENALLMDKSGESEAVFSRLERALSIAIDENKAKEGRNVRLIMAQMMFLQRNFEEALSFYDELVREDPLDFRPYFCKGMIFSLIDRNVEAKEMFAKYKELSPREFDVEGYLRSPLSRLKLFGTGSSSA